MRATANVIGRDPGKTYRIDEEESEAHDSFYEFILSMIEMHRLGLGILLQERC